MDKPLLWTRLCLRDRFQSCLRLRLLGRLGETEGRACGLVPARSECFIAGVTAGSAWARRVNRAGSPYGLRPQESRPQR